MSEDGNVQNKAARKLNSRGSGRIVVKRGDGDSPRPSGTEDAPLLLPKWGGEQEPDVASATAAGSGVAADEDADSEPDDAEEQALEEGAAREEDQMLRSLRAQMSPKGAQVSETGTEADEVAVPAVWPTPLDEPLDGADWPDLSHTGPDVEQWVVSHGHMLVRNVTWNLAAKAPPSMEEVRKVLLPPQKFHIYFIGTEECERSIAASAINPSKRNWENFLEDVLGEMYMPLRAHTLQAMHIIAFAHRGISHLCSDLTSGCIATGLGGTLGNKGAVAIKMKLGPSTTFTVVNSHLAAHQNAVKKRNEEFNKIDKDLPSVLSRRLRRSASFVSAQSVTPAAYVLAVSSDGGKPPLHDAAPTAVSSSISGNVSAEPVQGGNLSLSQSSDRVVFMGDMNYRVRGKREVVDNLLAMNMHEVMLHNDQLQWSMSQGHISGEYTEAPLAFRPTYKFDFGTDSYDTGKSQRIPSWTDRILFIPRGITCTAYNSDTSLKTSDHRPVYASFRVEVDFHAEHEVASADGKARASASHDFTSESQVCSIM
jgi:hypothetical protein